MRSTGKSTIVQRFKLGWAVVYLLIALKPALAADVASEDTQLAMLVRQLDMLDRLAEQSERLPHESVARYHFDYGRLHADVERIRTGIRDYLSPPRAQPRDPDALLGDYRVTQDKTAARP